MTATDDRDHAALSHLERGNQHKAKGNLEAAIASYRTALALQPDLAAAYSSLAEIFTLQGKTQDAISYYEQAVKLQSDVAVWQAALGSLLEQQGWTELAIPHYCKALDLDPSYFTVESHVNLGNMLRQRGQLDLAIARYQTAIQLHPHEAQPHRMLAETFLTQGNLQAAMAVYTNAGNINLDLITAKEYNDLGIAWMRQGNSEAAMTCFQEAISLQPDYADAHCNLGNAFIQVNNLREAVLCFQEALAIDPNFTEVYYNLGTILAELDRFDEAIACFQAAIELRSSFAEAHYNLATALVKQNHLEMAIASYETAITLKPNYGQAHWNLGFALLLSGNFQRGFAEYDWRWRARNNIFAPPRSYSQPLWRGEDLTEQTILLYDDQGFGDFIQLVRYAVILVERCKQVIIESSIPLARLLTNTIKDVKIVTQSERLPEFNVHLPMISLPRLLGTTLDHLPSQVPYLDLSVITQFNSYHLEAPSTSKRKIGIVWASGYKSEEKALVKLHREKSCPLSIFEPLLSIPNIDLYSLQVGINSTDIQQLAWQDRIQDLSVHIQDFADTAALIAQLDLVISVDTAVAHLAGAMAKPTWLLLPFSPDWRWLLERSDSPWYPTMRLFRQPQPQDWQSVIAQVVSSLNEK